MEKNENNRFKNASLKDYNPLTFATYFPTNDTTLLTFYAALKDSILNTNYYDVVLITDRYHIGSTKFTKLYSINEIVLKYL